MSKKGGKKGSKQESLYKVLHAQNPNITREMVKQAGGMTGMGEMLKLYAAPTASENYNTAAINRLKTDAQIEKEQSDAFATTRQIAANAASSATGLTSGFTGALGAATGNLVSFGGTNAAALQGLVNAGEASTGDTLGATSGLLGMSAAGLLEASIAEKRGVSSAKSQRSVAEEGYRKDRAGLKDARRTSAIDLKSKNQAAIVSMISSLLGLAPAGGSGGGSGSGGSGSGGSGGGNLTSTFDVYAGWTPEQIASAKAIGAGLNGLMSASGTSTTTSDTQTTTPAGIPSKFNGVKGWDNLVGPVANSPYARGIRAQEESDRTGALAASNYGFYEMMPVIPEKYRKPNRFSRAEYQVGDLSGVRNLLG